ncbi:hypothetical protein HZC31_04250 [Candidatus Woesearchaeota archaeon]|nr:hypothetical protein [Candidatus Woesearchaeota archaeon]
MTSKILTYAGVAATIIGLGSAYYCGQQVTQLDQREDLRELYAVRETLNATKGLQYLDDTVRETAMKQLEARKSTLESNPEITEADTERSNYHWGFIIFGVIGVVPFSYYTRSKR